MDWAFPVHSFFSELAASCFVQGVGAVAWDEMWALFCYASCTHNQAKVEVLFFSYFDVRYRSPAAAMDGWAGFLVKHHLATCLWVSGQVRPSVSCCGFWMLLADLRIKDSRGAASVRAIANLHERTQLVI